MSDSKNFRDRPVYVSARLLWMLGRIVAARNGTKAAMDTPLTIDALAEAVLTSSLSVGYPELDGLYAKRRAIDDEAVKTITSDEVKPIPF